MTWSTCDLADEHGDEARVVVAELRHFGGLRRFSGQAATVRCVDDNSMVREQIESMGNERVLVVDGGGSLRTALIGDTLAEIALANGWAGIILDACVRDTTALATIELGVMALGTSPRRSAKRREGVVDVPVELGGVVVSPGDRVYADEDGIVVLAPTA